MLAGMSNGLQPNILDALHQLRRDVDDLRQSVRGLVVCVVLLGAAIFLLMVVVGLDFLEVW